MIDDRPKPRVGVGVAVIKNNKILLGRRKGAHGAGDWSFAGGHLEFREDVEQCAKRELMEETGLNALSLSRGPWVTNVIDGNKHYITLFVFVTEFEGELQLLEPDKCEGWKWCDWHALPSPLFPPVATLIQKVGIEKLTGIGKEKSLHISF